MNYGIQIPGMLYKATRLDEYNGDMICQDTFKKYMENYCRAFELHEIVEKTQFEFTEITCHLLFDLNIYMNQRIVMLQVEI